MTTVDEAREALLALMDGGAGPSDDGLAGVDALIAAIRTEYEDEDGNRAAYEEGWTKAEAEYHLRSDDAEAKLAALREAGRAILPEVMEAELGSVIGADAADGIRIVQAKADRWVAFRAALDDTPAEEERT